MFLTLSTIGVLGAPRGSGKISAVNIGVYLDSKCTVNCTAISWGNINPGGTVTKTVYVKNLGAAAVTLQIATSSWNPAEAESLVTLSWSRNNYLLRAGKVVPAVLTLTLASNTSSLRDFSFDIIITGIQKI